LTDQKRNCKARSDKKTIFFKTFFNQPDTDRKGEEWGQNADRSGSLSAVRAGPYQVPSQRLSCRQPLTRFPQPAWRLAAPAPPPGVRITRPGWRSQLLAVCVRVCLRRTVVHIVQIRPIDS
jgi:hypothetical protein